MVMLLKHLLDALEWLIFELSATISAHSLGGQAKNNGELIKYSSIYFKKLIKCIN